MFLQVDSKKEGAEKKRIYNSKWSGTTNWKLFLLRGFGQQDAAQRLSYLLIVERKGPSKNKEDTPQGAPYFRFVFANQFVCSSRCIDVSGFEACSVQ